MTEYLIEIQQHELFDMKLLMIWLAPSLGKMDWLFTQVQGEGGGEGEKGEGGGTGRGIALYPLT